MAYLDDARTLDYQAKRPLRTTEILVVLAVCMSVWATAAFWISVA